MPTERDFNVTRQWPVARSPSERLVDAFTSRREPLRLRALMSRTVASRLRDLLLPKLVTGQIDVSSLDLDRVA